MPVPAADEPQASAWNLPNALTVLRLFLVPLLAWLLLREGGDDDLSRVGAFLTFSVAMVTDKVDGDLARKRGLVTDFGKIADPIADKALTGAAFIGLSLLHELPWWVTVVVLVRELGITALRFVVIRHGVMPAGRGGKVKTALQGLALGLYLLPLPASLHPVEVVAMGIAVTVTVGTGIDYVAQAVRLRRDSPRTAARRAHQAGAGE
ncbi:MAG: CDP-diacylglycerol--glycerol-3-phosphate 3-phosphatidyltransferase [Jiangellaceae bacterium]